MGQQALLCQQDRRTCVFQHERQTFLGVFRVQRHVSATSFEDPQHGHDHLQGPFHTQAHQNLRTHSQRPQMVRQLICPLVQFPVSQLPTVRHHGHCARAVLHLCLEELWDAGGAGVIRLGLVPVLQ